MPVKSPKSRAHVKLCFVFLLSSQIMPCFKMTVIILPHVHLDIMNGSPSHLNRTHQERRLLVLLHMASKLSLPPTMSTLSIPSSPPACKVSVPFLSTSQFYSCFPLIHSNNTSSLWHVFLICHNQIGTTSMFRLVTSVYSERYQEPRTHKVLNTFFFWLRKKKY